WPAYFDGSTWIELGPHATFEVSGSTTMRIEERNSALSRGPTQWSWNDGSDARASGGSYMATRAPDATLRFAFKGTSVSWVGIGESCSGQAEITIDGVSEVVDAYRPTGVWQDVLYRRSDLPNALHTFTLRVLGTNQPASCAPWIYVDAFDIVGTAVTSVTRMEENDSSLTRGPTQWNWNDGPDSRASN